MNTQKPEDDVIGGGVQIQMMAKGPEDDDLYGDPEDGLHPLFSEKHKRHSHMASEEKTIPFENLELSYYSETSSIVEIPESGEAFISNMYIHIDISRFLSSAININGKKIPYFLKNNIGLRCIKRIKVYTNKYTLCDIDSDGLYILLHSFYSDKPGFKTMIGDYSIEEPTLVSKVVSQHVYLPIPLWFAKTHSQLFPLCMMDEPLKVKVDFNKGKDIIVENPDDDFRIAITLTEYQLGVKLDMEVFYSNESTLGHTYEGEKEHLAELIVEYKIPTETELSMIKDDRTQEYIIPQLFSMKDSFKLKQHRYGMGTAGVVYPSLSSFHLACKMIFFVIKANEDFLEFEEIQTCRIGDKDVVPTELEYMTPYLKGYTAIPKVYSLCPSLEPSSGHPSGQTYFDTDIVRITTNTENDDKYQMKYIKTYAICYNLIRFSNGEITQVFS
tara:strand:+ start:433 stop:1758 length:1326 start_codon:yes stop_codon:yes gene_type:complete